MRDVILYSCNAAIGLKVLYCLSQANVRVHVISANAESYLRYSRYCHAFHAIRNPDPAAKRRLLVQKINELAQRQSIEAVLGDDIRSHALLNELARQLDAPAFAPAPRSLLEACHDKWSFYERLSQCGLPIPPSVKIATMDDLTEARVAAVGFPLLVKPLNAESSHGIHRFDDYSVLRHYLTTPGPYKALPLKLQQLIVGPTIGLSLLALDGRVLCHDIQRHAQDGARIFEPSPEVLDIGRRIVAAFGYGGPGHIDFVRDSKTGQVYALEFNCRYWYSLPVSLWRGSNFPSLAVKLARGHEIPFSPTRPGAYFQPGNVIAMFKQPWRLAQLDRANWRGFWQAISDPLPHLTSYLKSWRPLKNPLWR